MTNATIERDVSSTHQRKRPWRRIITWSVVGTVTLALLVTGGVVGWKYRHPTLFYPASNGISAQGRIDIGRALFIGMTYAQGHPTHPTTVHVDGVSPRVEVNTAGASVTFFVCRLGPHPQIGAIGSAYGADIHQECPILVPASNVDMTVKPAFSDQIVMRIQLNRPGTLLVNGMDLHYSTGWQHGWQWVGDGARFTAVAATPN